MVDPSPFGLLFPEHRFLHLVYDLEQMQPETQYSWLIRIEVKLSLSRNEMNELISSSFICASAIHAGGRPPWDGTIALSRRWKKKDLSSYFIFLKSNLNHMEVAVGIM